jgi:hypothetical protein
MARSLALVVLFVAFVAGCSGSAASPSAALPTDPGALTDAQSAWCSLHTGGPGDDAHQVEDMALTLGVIPGAKTRDDVFARWAGHPVSDPDLTYKIACIAAYAAFGSATPAAS